MLYNRDKTDWTHIPFLYDALVRLVPTWASAYSWNKNFCTGLLS